MLLRLSEDTWLSHCLRMVVDCAEVMPWDDSSGRWPSVRLHGSLLPPDSHSPTILFVYSFILFIFFFNFYLFIIVTERKRERERERERGRDIGRGRSRLHAPGAQRGIRSRVSRIAPWAKGRHQTAAPPRDPYSFILKFYLFIYS